MLKVTKAKVCAIMDVARSLLARASGMRTVDRRIWGRKATDSIRSEDEEGIAESR